MIFKSDKLDYLRGPKTKKNFDDLFNIGQGPSNVGKLNWNLLGFSSFTFKFRTMCAISIFHEHV